MFSMQFLVEEVLLKTLKDKLKFFLIIFSNEFLTASVVAYLTSFLSMCALVRQLVHVFEGPGFQFCPSLNYLEAF